MSQELEDFGVVSNFKVTIEGLKEMEVESVSGLGGTIEDVPYQGEKQTIMNRPGRFNANDIMIVRRFKKDKELYNWIKDTRSGKGKRVSGSVILMDQSGGEVVRFNFQGAWPKDWSGPELNKSVSGTDTLLERLVLSVADIEIA
jgi:phage tail-like protein